MTHAWRPWLSRVLGKASLCVPVYPGEMVKTNRSHEGCALKAGLCDSQSSSVFPVHSDYVVQFEEDQFQPGVWHDHSKFPGSVNSAVLHLSPYVNYQFRVIAVNEVGSSHPSLPSERYRTSGAREYLSSRCPEFSLPDSSQPWGLNLPFQGLASSSMKQNDNNTYISGLW